MPQPPSRRDVTDLSQIVLHHAKNLRRMDPGYQGGRFDTPGPVIGGASPIVGGDDGGDSDSGADQILFCNTDQYLISGSGDQTFQLSHVPLDGSLQAFWMPLRMSVENWTLQDDALTVTDPGWRDGDLVEVAYAYEYDGEPDPSDVIVDYGSVGVTYWRWFQTSTHNGSVVYADPAYDDSAWVIGQAPFGETTPPHDGYLADYVTVWDQGTRMWARMDVAAEPGVDVYLTSKWNRALKVYWNGGLVVSGWTQAGTDYLLVATIPGDQVLASNLLAVQVTDDAFSGPHTGCYFDMGISQAVEESPL